MQVRREKTTAFPLCDLNIADSPRNSGMIISFTKMNGAGNDFVMLDNRDLAYSLTKEQIAHLCDRHRGIGADGLLAAEPCEGEADFRFRYYNACLLYTSPSPRDS